MRLKAKLSKEEIVQRISQYNKNIEIIGEYINTNTKVLFRCKADGFDKFIDQRLDQHNAITLSEQIHSEFHSLYGYGNNTKEQFYEFVDMLYLQGRIARKRYNNFVKNFK